MSTLRGVSFPSTIRPPFSLSSLPYPPLHLRLFPTSQLFHTFYCPLLPVSAVARPTPADDDPPEADEDTSHGVSRFQQINRQATRARRAQEEDYKKNQSVFLKAIKDVEDAPDIPTSSSSYDSGDDLFGEIDKAIAMKRKEFVRQGLLKPNPPKEEREKEIEKKLAAEESEELDPDEVVDLEEIDELEGFRAGASEEEKDQGQDEEEDDEEGYSDYNGLDVGKSNPDDPFSLGFDADFEAIGQSKVRIVDPKFKMTLAELLDECKVVPISVYGNLEVEITGIEHDSRIVTPGDLFVCCVGKNTDGHLYLTEADKRGAVAVVASKEIDIEETLGCKALVILEDTSSALPALAASFYKYPTRNMSVVGITGSSGKTTSAHLIKSMYEAMGLKTGMMSSVANFIHGDNRLESMVTIPDSVSIQKCMAKMLHNGTEAVVMETSSRDLASGKCKEVDFDIAVFTNLTTDQLDFHGSEKEYRVSKAQLFSRMVDPERNRKIVNIDDPNAPFFVSQGNPNVPVVTFSLENKNADVHCLKYELSLFETTVLVGTPQGILEISSGLLGKHNIYNILAAVTVGIAVGAPLEDIVRGIEEVDAVPGRWELIDEEQAFGVIVDHADNPEALSKLLDYVRELKPRRIITVFGCCGEKERGKRPMMAKIATDKSDVTMLTSDNPGNEDPLDILDDMLAGIGWTMQDYLKHGENDYYPPLANGHRLFLHDIRRVAVRAAVAMGEEGDMVVVAGKGHETYQIEGDKTEFFDDREECREALQYIDELHQAGIDTSEFPWRLPESH